MKRKIYNELLEWKNNGKKPLVVLGARQVGKTYIIEKFCKNEFKNYAFVNLFERNDIVDLYNDSNKTNSDDLFKIFCSMVGLHLEDDDCCLFIDEIQECSKLISELKYFCEKHPKAKIICAGSLLGIKLKKMKTPFPVGKVDMLTMYPMSFEEFLIAQGKEFIVDGIREHFKNNKEYPLHTTAMHYYKLYLISGGMPESVQYLIDNDNDISKFDCSAINRIISNYFDDMTRYVDNASETLKINKLYNSIPRQLANNAKKFQYTKVDTNARSRDYDISLEWLLANSMVIKCKLVSKPKISLESYTKEDVFKLYMNDVGITVSLLNFKNYEIMLYKIGESIGPVVENYVAQQLQCNGVNLYYWKNDATAEVDFILHTKEGIVPIEVKSGENTQSKSLKVYMERYNPPYAIRISSKNFGYDKRTNIKSIPLYAVFCIEES